LGKVHYTWDETTTVTVTQANDVNGEENPRREISSS
jgi:hypothetical protein